MRHSLIFLLISLLLAGHLNAQSTWSMVFPDIASGGQNAVTEVIQCPNGDLMAAGGNGDPYGVGVAFLMRIDSSGSLIWYREYDGYHSFVSVINLPSGGFLAGGIAEGGMPTSSILRADAMGNVVQAVHVECDYFGNARALVKSNNGFIGLGGFVWELNDALTSVNWVARLQPNGGAHDIEAAPGGFILTGTGGNVSISPTSYNDISLTKIDSLGNFQWSKSYGGMRSDNGRDVEPTNDGGFLIGGWSESFDAWQSEYFLIKVDSLGNYEWGKTYSDSSYGSWAHCVMEDQIGNFYIGGIHLNNEVMIVKTDTLGDLIWSKTFRSGTAHSIIQSADGNIVVAGETSDKQYFVFKMDTAGNTACSQDVTIDVHTRPFQVVNSANGGGIVTTVHQDTVIGQSYSKSFYSCEFLGTDELSEDQIRPAVEVFPNPASDMVNFKFNIVSQNNSLKIYSLQGKLIQVLEISEGLKEKKISLVNFPDGMYIYHLISQGGETHRGKFTVYK